MPLVRSCLSPLSPGTSSSSYIAEVTHWCIQLVHLSVDVPLTRVDDEFYSLDNILRTWLLSKWFYDTSTGAATGAARYGSFVGGGFGLLVASYG
jgi:hypothetical protein